MEACTQLQVQWRRWWVGVRAAQASARPGGGSGARARAAGLSWGVRPVSQSPPPQGPISLKDPQNRFWIIAVKSCGHGLPLLPDRWGAAAGRGTGTGTPHGRHPRSQHHTHPRATRLCPPGTPPAPGSTLAGRWAPTTARYGLLGRRRRGRAGAERAAAAARHTRARTHPHAPMQVLHTYDLKRRRYLGPTSMDTEMAFLMCNMGLVRGFACFVLACFTDRVSRFGAGRAVGARTRRRRSSPT